MQARVVEKLWKAFHEKPIPDVNQQSLLNYAESGCVRLTGLFRSSEAWGTLVIPGAKGTYRLCDPSSLSKSNKIPRRIIDQ